MFASVVGHSVIARLAQCRLILSLCRVPPGLNPRFHGISGAWAQSFFQRQVPNLPPDIVFLQVGEKEVSNIDSDSVMRDIITVCRMLIRNGVGHVVIGAMTTTPTPPYALGI
ncbi:hypothetical protein ACJMK2_024844 [Sinanodonta woodiana]|uniref:Uncharacterized protein n=1 Tax=Sinanodonta woodiana TaxID=1069815 RepID=A0ABD3XEN5_SINWO